MQLPAIKNLSHLSSDEKFAKFSRENKPQKPYNKNVTRRLIPSSRGYDIEIKGDEDIFSPEFRKIFYDVSNKVGNIYGPRAKVLMEYQYRSIVSGIKSGYCKKIGNLIWTCTPHRKVMDIIKCKSLTTAKKFVNLMRHLGLMLTDQYIGIKKHHRTGRVLTSLSHAFNPTRIFELWRDGVPENLIEKSNILNSEKTLENIADIESVEIVGEPFIGLHITIGNIDITNVVDNSENLILEPTPKKNILPPDTESREEAPKICKDGGALPILLSSAVRVIKKTINNIFPIGKLFMKEPFKPIKPTKLLDNFFRDYPYCVSPKKINELFKETKISETSKHILSFLDFWTAHPEHQKDTHETLYEDNRVWVKFPKCVWLSSIYSTDKTFKRNISSLSKREIILIKKVNGHNFYTINYKIPPESVEN